MLIKTLRFICCYICILQAPNIFAAATDVPGGERASLLRPLAQKETPPSTASRIPPAIHRDEIDPFFGNVQRGRGSLLRSENALSSNSAHNNCIKLCSVLTGAAVGLFIAIEIISFLANKHFTWE